MKPILLLAVLFASCKTTSFYVVRHAEKEPVTTTTDVPLSAAGSSRAVALSDALQDKGIKTIYATPTNRTTATARPLSRATGVAIQLYDAGDMRFLENLKKHRGAPVLVVGHSNTVDEVVNWLAGKNLLQDLPDTQYGDLFVLKIRGKKAELEKGKFGN